MQLYFGDLHNHCGISYGFGSLENALRQAESHLDFCCVTGHAMWPDMYARNPDTAFIVDFHNKGFEKLRKDWQNVLDTINAHNTENFVTFQSYEMHSSRYGDHHLVSPDPDLPLIYRQTPRELVQDCGCRAIAVPHHIGYTPGYRGISWEDFDSEISPFVEVYSKHGCSMREGGPYPYYHDMGPLDPRNTVEEGLRQGKRFSFVGSTDHHAGFPGSYGDGLTAVWAEAKTRDSIWDAMQKGHVYALTGDRMACSFTLNEAMMGDRICADRRKLHLYCEGDDRIALMTIRRNGRIIASVIPNQNPVHTGDGRYKLRLELGWSSQPEKYHWDGTFQIDGGQILRVQPYYRGRNALSPHDKSADNAASTNDLDNGCCFDRQQAQFHCDTVCNISTLHPQTCAFVFEVQGSTDAAITLTVNGQKHTHQLKELLEYGFTAHMQPWHSHAYKLHTALPAVECIGDLELEDLPETAHDVYYGEVIQENGSHAFISPIFVDRP